jgi:hypothetical protein
MAGVSQLLELRSANSNMLVSGSMDGSVVIFDMQSREVCQHVPPGREKVGGRGGGGRGFGMALFLLHAIPCSLFVVVANMWLSH